MHTIPKRTDGSKPLQFCAYLVYRAFHIVYSVRNASDKADCNLELQIFSKLKNQSLLILQYYWMRWNKGEHLEQLAVPLPLRVRPKAAIQILFIQPRFSDSRTKTHGDSPLKFLHRYPVKAFRNLAFSKEFAFFDCSLYFNIKKR